MSVTVIWSGLNRTETKSAAATQAAPCACQQAREVVALIEGKRWNLIQAGVFCFSFWSSTKRQTPPKWVYPPDALWVHFMSPAVIYPPIISSLKFEILQENPRWVSSPTMSQWKKRALTESCLQFAAIQMYRVSESCPTKMSDIRCVSSNNYWTASCNCRCGNFWTVILFLGSGQGVFLRKAEPNFGEKHVYFGLWFI